MHLPKGNVILGISVLLLSLFVSGFAAAEDKPDAMPEVLKPWQGVWDVTHSVAVNGSEFVVAERLGLGGKDVVAVVKGNQLFVADKLFATLTTDFSESNLDVEQKVLYQQKAVMFTLVNGKGITCVYQVIDGDIVIRHPDTSGNVSWRSSFILQRHK
jgi:hypothetical protein